MNQTGILEIIRSGQALDISDREHYLWEDVDGFGMPPLHRITERGPLQHGQSDRGYRLDPRLIQIALTLIGSDAVDYYARRAELLNYLSPVSDMPLSLRYTDGVGQVYQIDGHCAEGPVFSGKDFSSFQNHRVAFRITCPDPAWYDPTPRSVRVIAAAAGSGFTFPMQVPWTFGGTTVDTTVNLDYAGTWLEYPEIVITGPVSDAKVEHLETGDILDLDGVVIADGDHYTIDLRYGRKTVVNASGVNKIAELTPASDLATWRLQPGANTIRLTGTSAGANTSILIRYYNRYIGV